MSHTDIFNKAGHDIKKTKLLPSPFSLRLTHQERRELEARADGLPLSAFIRHELLGEQAEQRRSLRKPKLDDKKFALLLSALGESRLTSNLNQLAKHANMGTLDVSDETTQVLQEAYDTVIGIREILLKALGHRA